MSVRYDVAVRRRLHQIDLTKLLMVGTMPPHEKHVADRGNERRQKFMTDNVKAIIDDGGSLMPTML